MSVSGGGGVSPDHILQTGLGFLASKSLLSAIELDVFSHLAVQPGDLNDLEKRLGLHPRSSRDFLDALVALGFLERAAGVYRNTPAAETFLDRAKPSYIGGLLEMCNHRLFGFWNHLTTGLRTGEPQNEIRSGGKSLFEVLYADQPRLKEFLKAMTGLSRGANMAIAQQFPWQKYSTFVDVGTAQGDLAVQVALANGQLSGTGFDLPAVQPIFEEHAMQQGVASRLRFAGGDFFADPLPKADVVMMGHILHDWDLDQKKQLVRKAYDAVPVGGALIVYEAIIDDERRTNAFGLLMSLNMLIETTGGFDYTGADCIGWMKEAGFRDGYVEHLVGPDSMVVGLK